MNTTHAYRPRRSCLYMPGANERALEKACSLPADMVILDLEDSVAPDLKATARANIHTAVSNKGFGSREVVIRSNSLDSEWGRDDLLMAVSAAPDGVLVPKVCSAEDIVSIDALLSEAGAPADLALWVMIEMPLAILNIQAIAATSASTRLTGFMMGTNDLAKEMRAQATPEREAFQLALVSAVTAARAYDLVALDSVYNDIKNEAGLRAECEQGRVLGFDGKCLIHPAQLDITNEVFSPDPEAIAQARAIIDAFAQPENQGKGVITVEGRMTERLHLEQAEQLVAVQEAILAAQSEV